jgi:hypothetical protein
MNTKNLLREGLLNEELVNESLLNEAFYEDLKKWAEKTKKNVVDIVKTPQQLALLIKNLMDNPEVLSNVNTYYNHALSDKSKNLTDEVERFNENVDKIINIFTNEENPKGVKIINYLNKFKSGLEKYVTQVLSFFKKNIKSGWLTLLISIISEAILEYIIKKMTSIKKTLIKISKVKEFIKSGISDSLGEFESSDLGGFTEIFISLKEVSKDLFSGIADIFTTIKRKYGWLWDSVIKRLNKIADKVKNYLSNVSGAFNVNKGTLIDDLKTITENMYKINIEELAYKLVFEGQISNQDLRQGLKSKYKDITSMGLNPKERTTLDTAIDMLTKFFAQKGNQAVGPVYNKFNQLKKELVKLSDEINSNLDNTENVDENIGLDYESKIGLNEDMSHIKHLMGLKKL